MNDRLAAEAIAAGGGLQEVVDATGLRTRENVLSLIDPLVWVGAFNNDQARKGAMPPRRRIPAGEERFAACVPTSS